MFKKIDNFWCYNYGYHIYIFSCSHFFSGTTDIIHINYSDLVRLKRILVTKIMGLKKPCPKKRLTWKLCRTYLAYVDYNADSINITRERYLEHKMPEWTKCVMKEFGKIL